MAIRAWLNRWVAAAIACICLLFVSGLSLFWLQANPAAFYTVNDIRIRVNPILQVLEAKQSQLPEDGALQQELKKQADGSGTKLTVASLDGKVLFSTADSSLKQVDVRHDVHYDLHQALGDEEQLTVAFPIVDQKTGKQAGNALFTVPFKMVISQAKDVYTYASFILFCLSAATLVILLFHLKRNIVKQLLRPIAELKEDTAAMLKGDLTQRHEYGRPDEIGEVFGMIDQLRTEMLYLNELQSEQTRSQKELITNISHDLKTPLTSIKAYAEAIEAGVCLDAASLKSYIRVVRSNAEKMNRLVEDLLTHALNELGQVSVTPVEMYSRGLLKRLLLPLSHMIEAAGAVYRGPDDVPDVLIQADEKRLEQVMANLVANALKHIMPGDEISIQAVQEASVLRVTIADTGSGMHPEDMPFIFERYYQGRTARSMQNDGSGLGLSICKHIIEVHGGKISFTSKKDLGTAFAFTLPLC